jgi:hypothetical protein
MSLTFTSTTPHAHISKQVIRKDYVAINALTENNLLRSEKVERRKKQNRKIRVQ